jgi:subtilase family serine protease
VKVTVKNQGTGTARFPPESLILGGPDLNFQYAWGQGETFGPGVSKTYRLIKGDPRVGTFIWKTIVDPGHKVIETNENNNEKTIQVTIDH